jgi:hypothetical protein
MFDNRATLKIEWSLDPVPGWNNGPEDLRALIEHFLAEKIPHYKPVVTVITSKDA